MVEEVVRVVTTPNITLLSDEFFEDVRQMEEKNLAVELLERLQGKIKALSAMVQNWIFCRSKTRQIST